MMNIRTYMIGAVLCIIALPAVSQGYSPAAMEQLKQKRLWLQSQNAAGMVFDETANYSNLQVSYNHQDGNYHRPQEGEKTGDIGVSSEGFLKLDDVLVWGSFSFKQRNMTDAGYNASITDPFRGMPYYVIDEHQSDWRNQYYDLRFRASTPLINGRWALGLEGVYQVSLAAKQRDPRVDSRFYTLKVVPAITYRLNDRHKLGLSLHYESIKEDSRMENENDDIDQNYYLLYGLGTAVQYIGAGQTTNYYGDRLGASLQYNYSNEAWNVLLEGSYYVRAENVELSYNNPRKDSGVKDKTARFTASAWRQGTDYTHYLKGAYTDCRMDGVQYVTEKVTDAGTLTSDWVVLYKSIRSTYDTRTASLDYALSKNRGREYSWKVEAGVAYRLQEDVYLLPHSWKKAENLWIGLGGKWNVALGSKLNNRLLLEVQAGCNRNLSGGYAYGGSHADYVSVTGLETSDTNYLNSDYTRWGGSLTYSQLLKQGEKMNLFLRAAFHRIDTSDYDYSGRSFLSMSAGCNF